jgi:hypothetical protein
VRTKLYVLLGVAGVAVATAIACADKLEDLAPFPCADDGTCPIDFTCVDGKSCKAGVAVDRACSTLTQCAEGSCVGGACLPPCVSGGGSICGPGRVCSYPPPGESSPLARCVVDCSAGTCPAGQECVGLFGGTKGCVTPAARAALDKACNKPEDCQTRYGITFLPITCARGTCVPFCATIATPSAPAPTCADPARFCHVADPVLESGCLVSCDDGDGGTRLCAEGLKCEPAANGPAEPSACVAIGDAGRSDGSTL